MIPLARVALVRLVRDRSNLFFVVVLPFVLVLLIGLSFGGEGQDIRVLFAGPEDDSTVDGIVRVLADDGLEVERRGEREARDAVADGTADAAIVVPALDGDGTATVEVVIVPDGTEVALLTQVEGAVAAATSAQRATRALVSLGVQVEPDVLEPGGEQVALTQTVVDVEDGLAEAFAGLGQFDIGASSQLLLFVFVTALTSGAGVVQARRWGIVDRVLAGPTRTTSVIAGLALGQLLVALGQALLIVGVTGLLFDVNWGDPLATGAVVLAFSAVAASAGLLLGATLDNEEQVGGIGPALALGLAALGGSMLPLELFPDWLRGVANATPHAWGNTAFAEIVRRDGTIVDVLPNLAVLTGFTLVLGGTASVVLRRRIARG